MQLTEQQRPQIKQLELSGKTHSEIAVIYTSQGFTAPKGGKLTNNSIYYFMNKSVVRARMKLWQKKSAAKKRRAAMRAGLPMRRKYTRRLVSGESLALAANHEFVAHPPRTTGQKITLPASFILDTLTNPELSDSKKVAVLIAALEA